jgi:uncharacterized membrane protein YdjX (TVP38/TMEM64 family)
LEAKPAKPANKGLNWKTWRWETIGSYALVGAVLIVAVIVLGEAFKDNVTSFENWLAGHGYRALIIAVVLYAVFAALFVPDTLLGLVAGASFGFTRGIIIAIVASLIAAIVEYLLARRLLKPLIDRHLGSRPSMKALQAAVKTQEFKLQFLIRLTPINRAVTSYVLGASGVRFSGFIAAAAGFLPHLCLEVYFGYASKHLAVISGQTRDAVVLHDVLLVSGLLITIVVIFLISRTAKKAVESALEHNNNA